MAHLININGKVKMDFFPEEWIALGLEIRNHPVLVELLQKHHQSEFEVILAEIAAYCEVILDGFYTREDISNICKICTERLIRKRGTIILLNGTGSVN
jgi:hypothetical protein